MTDSLDVVGEEYAKLAIEQPVVPPPTNPLAVARMFLAEHFTHNDGSRLLHHHRGDFYQWSGTCWPECEDRGMRSELYRWLESAVYPKKEELVAFEPTRVKVGNVVEALQAICHLGRDVTPPAWLGDGQTPASEIVAMANGLLHIPTRRLFPHSPSFFSRHSLPFDYDPDAPQAQRWEHFVKELFDDDMESIETLQEAMGYAVAGGTRLQKMFMFVGPPRSGRGTIARVLTGLLGQHNVAGPTLASLTTNFGLEPLIGKPLAIISDARLSSRANSMVAVERLLSISGEDSLTIDRKYREPWTGRLPTRFLILTNELPNFSDSSGALSSRFVLLRMIKSFYDREDPTLTDQLLTESTSIFLWVLEGLDRLNDRGHFVMPESAREALRDLQDLSSPVGAFVRDRCKTGAGLEVSKDALYAEWRDWCGEGRAKPTTKAVFIRDLRAALPGIELGRPRHDEGVRVHVVRGLGLREQLRKQWTEPLTTPDRAGPDMNGDALWSGLDQVQSRRSADMVRDGQGFFAPDGEDG